MVKYFRGSHKESVTKALLKNHGLKEFITCTQCNRNFYKDDTFKCHMLFSHGRFINSMERARDMMLVNFKRLYE